MFTKNFPTNSGKLSSWSFLSLNLQVHPATTPHRILEEQQQRN